MPVTPTYPGVYIEEVPSGVRAITGIATSIAAFVGYTARGSVNRAVRIFNLGDYERNFGGLHPDSEISYAVRQFFLNGGTDAYVVRVARGAVRAQAHLRDLSYADIVLDVQARNEGAWGNDIRLEVDYETDNPDSTFNMAVLCYERRNGRVVLKDRELHRNLSMNSRASRYVCNVLEESKFVRVQRRPGLGYEPGYSLGAPLTGVPALGAESDTLTGILDGTTPFTLTLNTAAIADLDDLVTRISDAITTAGLAAGLSASRADAMGGHTGTQNRLMLTSLNATVEYSSVQILRAPSRDASLGLRLGLQNGGREIDGASSNRPAPTGTLSDDLVEVIAQPLGAGHGDLTVNIQDASSGAPVPILTAAVLLNLPTDVGVGPQLCGALQAQLRTTINHPAARQATVRMNGTYLRVVPSADTPNAIITFTGTAAGNDYLRLATGGAAQPAISLQQYNLGTGATYAAQDVAVPADLGNDGSEPGADEIIGRREDKSGIHALRDVDIFNILAIPRTAGLADGQARTVIAAAIAFCEEQRAFYLVDPLPDRTRETIEAWVSQVGTSSYAAVYFPQIRAANPLDEYRLKSFPPSATVAGIYARTDSERGVWKAPAGLDAGLKGVLELAYVLTDPENGQLNQHRINCLRSFPVVGSVVWGARTLAGADELASEWKYVPIRRLALLLEESLFRGTQWVVFEPNDEPLWAKIRKNVGAFMMRLFRQGAFQGGTPDQAYYVKCDAETTTQPDRDLGIVNIEVGFAPLKPAEFVIIRIQQIARES